MMKLRLTESVKSSMFSIITEDRVISDVCHRVRFIVCRVVQKCPNLFFFRTLSNLYQICYFLAHRWPRW